MQSQHVTEKPTKRTSQKRAALKPPKETANEAAQDSQACFVAVDDVKFEDIVDTNTKDDPQEVAGYVDDILTLYRKKEVLLLTTEYMGCPRNTFGRL